VQSARNVYFLFRVDAFRVIDGTTSPYIPVLYIPYLYTRLIYPSLYIYIYVYIYIYIYIVLKWPVPKCRVFLFRFNSFRDIIFSNKLNLAQVNTNHVWKNQLARSNGLVTMTRAINAGFSSLGWIVFEIWLFPINLTQLKLIPIMCEKISSLGLMVWSQWPVPKCRVFLSKYNSFRDMPFSNKPKLSSSPYQSCVKKSAR